MLRSSDDLMAFGRRNRCAEGTLTFMADEEEGSAGLSCKLGFFKAAQHDGHAVTQQMVHTPATFRQQPDHNMTVSNFLTLPPGISIHM